MTCGIQIKDEERPPEWPEIAYVKVEESPRVQVHSGPPP